MPDFVLLPGELNLRFVRGDELTVPVNIQRNVSGYSWESYVYQSDLVTTGGGVESLSGIGATVTQPSITVTDAAAGSMTVALSETQTNLLSPSSTYRWYLRWVAPGQITRTIISGSVTAVAP